MAYRSASSDNGSGTSTPTVAVPVGVQADDIVILVVSSDSTDGVFTGTWPAGFTQLEDLDISGPDGQSAGAAWKRLTGADTGSYTLASIGSTNTWSIIAVAFSGRHTTNPPVEANTVNTTGNTTPVTVSAPTLTALSGDDLLFVTALDVTAVGIADNSTTAPSGYTERADLVAGGWSPMEAATLDNASAGATGTVSASTTLTSGSAGYAAFHMRIPAAGGGATTSLPGARRRRRAAAAPGLISR